jgi:hypothetical protein
MRKKRGFECAKKPYGTLIALMTIMMTANAKKKEEIKMVDFILECTCAFCGTPYPVKLRRMWLNLHDACPACGFENSLSESQAMKAHSLLEKLENEYVVMQESQPAQSVWMQ